jgi:hypothetical protein
MRLTSTLPSPDNVLESGNVALQNLFNIGQIPSTWSGWMRVHPRASNKDRAPRREPAFDLIQPRRVGGERVQRDVRMRLKKLLHQFGSMRGEVV